MLLWLKIKEFYFPHMSYTECLVEKTINLNVMMEGTFKVQYSLYVVVH